MGEGAIVRVSARVSESAGEDVKVVTPSERKHQSTSNKYGHYVYIGACRTARVGGMELGNTQKMAPK